MTLLLTLDDGSVQRKLADAVEFARAAVLEDAPEEQLGAHVGATREDAVTASHLFEAQVPGYGGWRWSVTVAVAAEDEPVTVSEVVLVPGPSALVAPAWVPWERRVRAGDLGVGDIFPTPENDPRLAPAYLQSDDPAVEETAHEVGLGRVHVLSRFGRTEAASRWHAGEFGPRSDMARSAPDVCGTCGFFVPLAGSLRGVFGVCSNDIAPADGHVVDVEYGCGAHSEVEVEVTSSVPVAELVYDDSQLDFAPAPEAAEVDGGSEASGAVEAPEVAEPVEAPEATEVAEPAHAPEVLETAAAEPETAIAESDVSPAEVEPPAPAEPTPAAVAEPLVPEATEAAEGAAEPVAAEAPAVVDEVAEPAEAADEAAEPVEAAASVVTDLAEPVAAEAPVVADAVEPAASAVPEAVEVPEPAASELADSAPAAAESAAVEPEPVAAEEPAAEVADQAAEPVVAEPEAAAAAAEVPAAADEVAEPGEPAASVVPEPAASELADSVPAVAEPVAPEVEPVASDDSATEPAEPAEAGERAEAGEAVAAGEEAEPPSGDDEARVPVVAEVPDPEEAEPTQAEVTDAVQVSAPQSELPPSETTDEARGDGASDR
ncbi:DUF3027 domain-containing protein [Amycolatopsis sp. Hca4]|nr:DUF3027 domain-containing protein [Amycolatopsis sp. Hca4]